MDRIVYDKEQTFNGQRVRTILIAQNTNSYIAKWVDADGDFHGYIVGRLNSDAEAERKAEEYFRSVVRYINASQGKY